MARLHVFIRIPSDDAFALKAEALNNDSRLESAGIAALKFVGDENYLADGEFLAEVPQQEAMGTPSKAGIADGNLHVFVRIPNDDSNELEAQALNQDPRLRRAGIKAVRRAGDKKYIADGEFLAEVPAQEVVDTPSEAGIADRNLHVFVRVPNDDNYELKAQALNNNPDLKSAGITALRIAGEKQYIQDGKFIEELAPREALETPSDNSTATPINDGFLHVFVRIPDDDSNQLKAQALNQDPRLKEAGIKAVRRVGDQKYIVDGEFTPTFPARVPETKELERLTKDRLRVVVRMKNDDAYEFVSDHLNDDPRLRKADVSKVKLLKGQSTRVDVLPLPLPKKKRRARGCLIPALLLAILGTILTAGRVGLANGLVPDFLSTAQILVMPPSVPTASPVPPTQVTPTVSTPTSSPTSTPIQGATATRTRTTIRTPTARIAFLFTASSNAFCRRGPSTFFAPTGSVTSGSPVPIQAYSVSPQDNTSIWWQVLVNGSPCYISGTSGTANIQPNQVPFIQPPPFESNITGRVYNYFDDAPYPGETVELYVGSCSGTPVRTEVTDLGGRYFFDYIPAGNYCFRVLTSIPLYSTGGPAQASASLAENDSLVMDFDLDGPAFSPTETPTP